MEFLKRNEIGQLSDSRAEAIEKDIEEALNVLFNKWDNICGYDLEFIIHRKAAHMASMKVLKDGTKKAINE